MSCKLLKSLARVVGEGGEGYPYTTYSAGGGLHGPRRTRYRVMYRDAPKAGKADIEAKEKAA